MDLGCAFGSVNKTLSDCFGTVSISCFSVPSSFFVNSVFMGWLDLFCCELDLFLLDPDRSPRPPFDAAVALLTLKPPGDP